ncbi:hypothetical protein BUALT_Bualt02G0180400 [Buddleja alternifolia]|uniref:Peptidase metallopeptidase domain-containing protein n=1 Tax=Buddleja alternifolia TaxID=168488 RepID=A0AAV6Y2N4_9LAMI|nr:hypothetical protein BUALT_Bualt02G0180400 [Buddleja alternifolia]
MVPKFFHLFSFIFLLFLLIPFLYFSHATPHQSAKQSSSALDFLKPLIGTRKGSKAIGLSQLKKYLSNLGYLSNDNSNNPSHDNDDLFDDNLELAIKKFQQFVKLTVNGFLDANTVAKLHQPRCGVPDFAHRNRTQFQYTGSKYNFFPGEPKWPPTKRNLTYSFPLGTRIDLNLAILSATRMWANVSPFKFTFIPDYDKADIKISLQRRDHGDGSPFDGSGGILAHAFAPTDGRLHYDQDEKWWYGVLPGAYDLETVGLHELGHILGLAHSNDGGSIMWPYIGNGFRKGIGQDDINGLKALYNYK